MQLTPVYDGPGFLRFDVPAAADPATPLVRQRRRLASVLAGLDDDQWAAPTRCDAWSVQDVVTHLVTTNQFWAASIGAALAGAPTKILAAFDPVATPAALVEAERGRPPAETLDRYVESTEVLAGVVGGISGEGWSLVGEAPPGHVALRAVALHALWDAWIHERDVALPLGLAPAEEPDEIAATLVYAAALGPGFAVASGSPRRGRLVVEATGPDVAVVVELDGTVEVRPAGAGDAGGDDVLHLTGAAVELAEGLSLRAPMPCPVPDERRWLVGGLAEVFDRPSGP